MKGKGCQRLTLNVKFYFLNTCCTFAVPYYFHSVSDSYPFFCVFTIFEGLARFLVCRGPKPVSPFFPCSLRATALRATNNLL